MSKSKKDMCLAHSNKHQLAYFAEHVSDLLALALQGTHASRLDVLHTWKDLDNAIRQHQLESKIEKASLSGQRSAA